MLNNKGELYWDWSLHSSASQSCFGSGFLKLIHAVIIRINSSVTPTPESVYTATCNTEEQRHDNQILHSTRHMKRHFTTKRRSLFCCLTHCVSFTWASLLPISSGPTDTNWTFSDSDVAALLRLCCSASDAGIGETRVWTLHTSTSEGGNDRTHKWWSTAERSRRPRCRFPPSSRSKSWWEMMHVVNGRRSMRRAGRDERTSSALGRPVCGSTNAKVLTSNLLTWEWEAACPCLSTGIELLTLSKGLGHLGDKQATKKKKKSKSHFKDWRLSIWSFLPNVQHSSSLWLFFKF